jgi:transposase
LQVDGYDGFKRLAEGRSDASVTLAFCWVHMRRYFHTFFVSTKSPLAAEVLAKVRELYVIEAEIRGHPAERRRQERQQRSRPIVEALHDWLQVQVGRVPASSDLAKAIRYAIRHWPGLLVFLDDGRVEMDTNVVERAIRPHTMCGSLYPSSLSIWKHWKRVGVSNATRATLSGDRRFDRLRRQVISTDLVRRSGNYLLSGKDAGFDKAAYYMVCDA